MGEILAWTLTWTKYPSLKTSKTGIFFGIKEHFYKIKGNL